MIVSYDGTRYHGWQEQKDLPTIAQTLQDTFYQLFSAKISILGASRTDAGVHAHGQVAGFLTDLNIPLYKMLYAWNNALPNDIVIRSLEYAPEEFHPFYNVVRKTYHYHIFLQQPLPFVRHYGWFYSTRVDIDKLKNVLQHFVGTYDFTSFCAGDTPDPNKVRTVDAITVDYIESWQAYRITITAPRFLRYMIRRMVGAALKIATSPDLSVDYVRTVLYAKNANNALPTAAAQGLTLHEIEYQKDIANE